ncbi:hypothetical protein CR513_36933, partial [Mucuna pruriens]
MTNPNRKGWSRLLEDALWEHRTAYQTLLGMSPYRILQELDELRLEAYENSKIYKKKVKQFHDQQILRKEFQVNQKVLLFNSRLKLIASKLCSRWEQPFVITNMNTPRAPSRSNSTNRRHGDHFIDGTNSTRRNTLSHLSRKMASKEKKEEKMKKGRKRNNKE